MSRPRFLLDENLPRAIRSGVRRHSAEIDIVHVGDHDAPPIQTTDSDVLVYCERTQRILVTENRASMPGHVAALYQAGGRHWGILKVKKGRKQDIGGKVKTLILIWEVEEAETYLDAEEWIPF